MHWIYPLFKFLTCWVFVERGVQMTSTMTEHVEHSQYFTKADVESWLRIFGHARHCACVGSKCRALLCKCTRLCWATHGWQRNKGNVEPKVWPVSNLTQHRSTGCSNRLSLMSSTCWELVQWTNPVHLHAALEILKGIRISFNLLFE